MIVAQIVAGIVSVVIVAFGALMSYDFWTEYRRFEGIQERRDARKNKAGRSTAKRPSDARGVVKEAVGT